MRVDSRVQAVQMSRSRRIISAVDLKEIYAEKGDYSIKFLIDSKVSQSFTSCKVTMYDCQGASVPCESRRWGTKVNVFFSVTDQIPDGAAIIELALSGSEAKADERFRIWIVK